jgi:hypothetical protein
MKCVCKRILKFNVGELKECKVEVTCGACGRTWTITSAGNPVQTGLPKNTISDRLRPCDVCDADEDCPRRRNCEVWKNYVRDPAEWRELYYRIKEDAE